MSPNNRASPLSDGPTSRFPEGTASEILALFGQFPAVFDRVESLDRLKRDKAMELECALLFIDDILKDVAAADAAAGTSFLLHGGRPAADDSDRAELVRTAEDYWPGIKARLDKLECLSTKLELAWGELAAAAHAARGEEGALALEKYRRLNYSVYMGLGGSEVPDTDVLPNLKVRMGQMFSMLCKAAAAS